MAGGCWGVGGGGAGWGGGCCLEGAEVELGFEGWAPEAEEEEEDEEVEEAEGGVWGVREEDAELAEE